MLIAPHHPSLRVASSHGHIEKAIPVRRHRSEDLLAAGHSWLRVVLYDLAVSRVAHGNVGNTGEYIGYFLTQAADADLLTSGAGHSWLSLRVTGTPRPHELRDSAARVPAAPQVLPHRVICETAAAQTLDDVLGNTMAATTVAASCCAKRIGSHCSSPRKSYTQGCSLGWKPKCSVALRGFRRHRARVTSLRNEGKLRSARKLPSPSRSNKRVAHKQISDVLHRDTTKWWP